jgi:hypothetical protein
MYVCASEYVWVCVNVRVREYLCVCSLCSLFCVRCVVCLGPEMFVFWSLGAFLTILATTALPSKFGRKFVLAVTNLMAKSIGICSYQTFLLSLAPWHQALFFLTTFFSFYVRYRV